MYIVHPEAASYLLGFGYALGVISCLALVTGSLLARWWRARKRAPETQPSTLPPPPPPPLKEAA